MRVEREIIFITYFPADYDQVVGYLEHLEVFPALAQVLEFRHVDLEKSSRLVKSLHLGLECANLLVRLVEELVRIVATEPEARTEYSC
jgi:hypothetical protein